MYNDWCPSIPIILFLCQAGVPSAHCCAGTDHTCHLRPGGPLLFAVPPHTNDPDCTIASGPPLTPGGGYIYMNELGSPMYEMNHDTGYVQRVEKHTRLCLLCYGPCSAIFILLHFGLHGDGAVYSPPCGLCSYYATGYGRMKPFFFFFFLINSRGLRL